MASVALDAPPAAESPAVAAGGPAPWRWTRADYRRLGDLGFFAGKRVQLLRGEIVLMSAVNWPHSLGVRKTADALRAAFAPAAWVAEQQPIVLGEDEPEPDVAVYPGRPEDYTDHPTTALLLVEVSHTSLTFDLTEKAELYAEAGIVEYWVLDVTARVLHVLRDPRPVAAGGHRYHEARELTAADGVSPLAAPAAVIRVVELLP